MTARSLLSAVAALLCVVLLAASGSVVATGQLLAYQDGYAFFTTGDAFHVSPNVVVRDAAGGKNTIAPAARVYARATFDATGTITELDLSRSPFPTEGNLADVAQFAVALSSPVPNPDLLPQTPAPGESVAPQQHYSGKPVLVVFTVQVPPNTPFSSSIYMTTDASGWNPNAVIMDRVDSFHFRIIQRFSSGTIFRYLYDRGSLQQEEVAENGMQRKPRQIIVTDSDVRAVNDTVYAWSDMLSGGTQNPQPGVFPTPYNPAPFPNLPSAAPPPCKPPKCS